MAGLLEGLRNLSVFSQTGAGRSALRAHVDARELVRSAMRNRHELCTPAQQAALESITKASMVSFEAQACISLPAVLGNA